MPISINEAEATTTGVIKAETPSTKKILKILEPTTLPIAISTFFFLTATIDVANSGSEVPIETMVSPITRSESPKDNAIEVALLTIN